MALRQGQRYIKVGKGRIADYLYDHTLITLDEKVVGASDVNEDVVFLVEKVEDGQESK